MFRRILDVDEVPPKKIIHKTQIIWGYMGYDSNFDLLLASLQSRVMGLPTAASRDKPTTIIGFVRSIARVHYEAGEIPPIQKKTIHAGVYDLDNDYFSHFPSK